jgi:predicted nucleic acid-binding protein
MIFFYWLEAHPTNTPHVEQIHRKMKARGGKLCTSAFTIGEILAGAYKSGRLTEAQQIKEFFGGGEVRVLQFGTDAAECYAFIRASHNLSPADAIHLASASVVHVDVYVTNDSKLRKLVVDGIQFFCRTRRNDLLTTSPRCSPGGP